MKYGLPPEWGQAIANEIPRYLVVPGGSYSECESDLRPVWVLYKGWR